MIPCTFTALKRKACGTRNKYFFSPEVRLTGTTFCSGIFHQTNGFVINSKVIASPVTAARARTLVHRRLYGVNFKYTASVLLNRGVQLRLGGRLDTIILILPFVTAKTSMPQQLHSGGEIFHVGRSVSRHRCSWLRQAACCWLHCIVWRRVGLAPDQLCGEMTQVSPLTIS